MSVDAPKHEQMAWVERLLALPWVRSVDAPPGAEEPRWWFVDLDPPCAYDSLTAAVDVEADSTDATLVDIGGARDALPGDIVRASGRDLIHSIVGALDEENGGDDRGPLDLAAEAGLATYLVDRVAAEWIRAADWKVHCGVSVTVDLGMFRHLLEEADGEGLMRWASPPAVR